MLEGIRRYHPHLTELTAMSLAVGLMVGLSVWSQSSGLIDTSGLPSTPRVLNSRSQRTIRVEGFGGQAQEDVGDTLQGAEDLSQSGDVDQALQNPKDGNALQPNSGKSSFEQKGE